jgi:hypothetical protein
MSDAQNREKLMEKALHAQQKSASYYQFSLKNSPLIPPTAAQAYAAHWAHVARSNLFRLISPKLDPHNEP